jgi:hypothetical protein
MQRWSAPAAQPYVVPTYTVPDDTSWYHFLHGNVPRHQIDFIYRPVVPQAALSQQHFSHLSRLMKYIEPHTYGGYAFCIGNLSRDDVQYEPGHGGIALIFSMRILGATDHAGRPDPPFTHAIAAVDREISAASLLQAAMSFHRHMQFDTDSEAAGRGWYHTYARCAMDNPDVVENLLQAYIADFNDLPQTATSMQGARWTADGATQPRRIVIVRPDGCPFEDIAWCAARITAMLCQSDIRWTSITNGRESDIPNGVSIRILTEQEAGNPEAGELRLTLDQVAEQEPDLAAQLFSAKSSSPSAEPPSVQPNWRERYQAHKSSASEASVPTGSSPGETAAREANRFPSAPPPRGESPPAGNGDTEDPFRGQVADEIKRFRERRMEREAVDVDTPAAPDAYGAARQAGASLAGQPPAGPPVAPSARHEAAAPSQRPPPAPAPEVATRDPSDEPHRAHRIWPWVLLGALCVVGLPVAYFVILPSDPPERITPASSIGAPVLDPPKAGSAPTTSPPPENKAPEGVPSGPSGNAPAAPTNTLAPATSTPPQPQPPGTSPGSTGTSTAPAAASGKTKKPTKKPVFGAPLDLSGSGTGKR